MFGRPSSLCTEQTLMILPLPRGIMRCATARPTKNTLSMLVDVMRRQASVEYSAKAPRSCMPALLTRMWIGPSSASIFATPASTASASVTSKGAISAAMPKACSASRASTSWSEPRALSTTRAPAAPSAVASA